MRICNHCRGLLNDNFLYCPRCNNATAPFNGVVKDSPPPVGAKVMGFIGFGLGLTGFVAAIICFIYSIILFSLADGYYSGSVAFYMCIYMCICDCLVLAQNIVGMVLTGKAIDNYFRTGVTVSGRVMSIIGLVFSIVSIVFDFAGIVAV